MKINVDVDCTPEEVRTLLGLPDLSEVHDIYLNKFKTLADQGLTPDLVKQMMSSWAPMGNAGMDLVQKFMGGLASPGKKPTKD